MHREDIAKFLGEHVVVGVPHHSRSSPYYFFGVLLEANEKSILLKFNDSSGFKSINMDQIIDLHIDQKYININRRRL